MHAIDFSPLFRSTIGFDRMQRLLDSAARGGPPANAYPPYNIEARGEDAYRITMAVAGFREADLDITVAENRLEISGQIAAEAAEEDKKSAFLHRGIATRAFERTFQMADHIRVAAATLDNGLLHVDLVREVPEAMRRRKIEIGTGKPAIEQKAA